MSFPSATGFRRDLHQALRGLRRSPAFAATAILILGLGIGLATAAFGVFDAVLRSPLPVRDQNRIVVLWAEDESLSEGQRESPFKYAQFDRFRRATRTLGEAAAVINYGVVPQPISDGDRTLSLNGGLVAGNFFRVLGSNPALGRLLAPDDDHVGAPPAMVVSYSVWQREFGGSQVVGKQLRNTDNARVYTVVGVAPPGLDYPSGVDYWIPLAPATTLPSGQSLALVYIVGRLALNANPISARDELKTFIALEAASGVDNLGKEAKSVAAHTLPEVVVGRTRAAIVAVTFGAVLLLLIACASVGNLLLVRGIGRARDFSIRLALGASPGQLLRHLLLESITLALAGGVLGIVLALALMRAILAYAPPGLPRLDVLEISGVPLLISLLTTATAAVLFGIGPSVASLRVDLAMPLRSGARGGTETCGGKRAKQILVGAQIAFALAIVAAASVVMRSLARLQSLDMGFNTEHLSLIELGIPFQQYGGRVKLVQLHEEAVRRIEAVPGVIAATPVLLNPFNGVGGWDVTFAVEGAAQEPEKDAAHHFINVEVSGPDYFRTFGIPIRRGRSFSAADRDGSTQVIVVSEAVARRFWPGQDPLGRRLHMQGGPGVAELPGWWTVVGVVGETRYRDLLNALPTVYFPYQQYIAFGHLAVRTRGELASVYPALRRAVQESGAGVVLWKARPMDDLLAEPLSRPRLSTLLLTLFGGVALLLAAVGLYGTLAFAVRQRTRELGIRMALGATASMLRTLVLKEALTIAGLGALVGLAAAVIGMHFLNALLYETSPADPAALFAVSCVLAAVAIAAAYVPARRATRVDPAQSLRAE